MNTKVYDSFLVRVWRDIPRDEHVEHWRGEVEHIQSGTRWTFHTLNDLLAFLQQAGDRQSTEFRNDQCSDHLLSDIQEKTL